MTYILDLQRLWEEGVSVSSESQEAAAAVYLDPRKNVVSAIVVAHSNEPIMLQTLQSVLAQQFIRELIVVNCETSSSIEKTLNVFAKRHPKCHVVTGQKKAGLAAAYNLGAQYASGQFLLLFSGNCLLSKNAVLNMLATGIRKPAPWVIGGVDEKSSPLFSLKPWGRLKKLLSNDLYSLKYENQNRSHLEVSLVGGGFHASNVGPECLFLSTATFVELKGLDRKCFHSTFHKDLCLRIHYAGGGVYRAKDLNVIACSEPALSVGAYVRKEWQGFCGRHHFYQKYVSRNTNKILMGVLYAGIALHFIAKISFGLLNMALSRPSKQVSLAKQTSFN